jgi:hypothetical protein
MRISKRFWIGAAFLALGISAYFAVNSWLQSRTWEPVQMAISLDPGSVPTPEFTTNVSASYEIRFEAKTHGRLPAKVVECLLGTAAKPGDCAQQPSVLRVGWVLSSRGQVLEHGSTVDHNCCKNISADGITARTIGLVHCESGRPYILSINVLEDGTALSVADLRLHLISPGFSQSGSTRVTLLWIPSGTLSLLGIVLLVLPLITVSTRDTGTL